MNRIVASCTVVVAIAGVVISPAVSADAFSGLYVGGNVGVFTTATIEEENDTGGINDGEITRYGIEETFPSKLDLILGYGSRMNDLYLGVEAAYTASNETGSHSYRYPSGFDIHTDLGDGSHIGARMGYFLDDATLAYIKLAKAERNIEFHGDGFSEDRDYSGSGYGIGMEHDLASNFTVRLEAVHFDYSDETIDYGTGDFHYDPSETSIDVGVAYYF